MLRRISSILALLTLTAGCGAKPGNQAARRVQAGIGRVDDVAPMRMGAMAARAARPRLAAPAVTDQWALVVGIDHARGSRRLSGAVRDATTLRDALVSYGMPEGQVVVLTEQAATRERILAEIAQLAARVPAGGKAIFSFAGHARKAGGENVLVAADGKLVGAGVLARALGQVKAPLWANFPTCYAAGFRVPGIVGPNRVVTFASSANELAYEASWFGRSFLVQYMVADGMIAGLADGPSVEQAFNYAHHALVRDFPRYVPLIDDQFPGEFSLAGPAWQAPAGKRLDGPRTPSQPSGNAGASQGSPPEDRPQSEPGPTPYPQAPPAPSGIQTCGTVLEIDCRR